MELICALRTYAEVKNKILFGHNIKKIKNHFESGSFNFVFDHLKYLVIIWFIRNIYVMYSVSFRCNRNTTKPYSVYKQPNPNSHNFYSLYKERNYSYRYKFGFSQIIRIWYTPITLTAIAKLFPNRKCYQLFKLEMKFDTMK